MESNNRDLQPAYPVENLLEEARFTPSPAFQANLHDRLIRRLSTTTQVPAGPRERSNGYHARRRLAWTSLRWWQRALAGTIAALAALAGLIGFVPAVQAQVNTLLKHFGVSLPFTGAGLVISPFTPLAPSAVPTEINNFASLNLDTEAGNYIELRYFSTDTFIVIYETPTASGLTYPAGEEVKFGEFDCILTRLHGGMVLLAAPAPQPWRASGSGGGGGGGAGGPGEAPPMLGYEEALQITWVQDGMWIEMLTNLPEEEALRLAGTLQPAPQLLEK
ncbi:MAG: hypothetical protein AB9891_00680 [Anaerolineaceae bacterium]